MRSAQSESRQLTKEATCQETVSRAKRGIDNRCDRASAQWGTGDGSWQGRDKAREGGRLTGLGRGAIGGLLLVVLGETSNEVGLVAGMGQTPLREQLLKLRNLHGVVVGHGESGFALARSANGRGERKPANLCRAMFDDLN